MTDGVAEPWWEADCRDFDAPGFGGPSPEFNDVVTLLPPGSRALDLGCGDGRHALYLARFGFHVTAIDTSTAGVAKLAHRAEAEGLPMVTRVEDMREFVFDQDFDLMVAHGSMQMVERDEWKRIIYDCQVHTTVNGVHVMAVLTNAIPPPPDLSDFFPGLFREGELYDLYEGWETILCRSYVKHDEHPGGIRHQHPMNKLVARKVGA